MQLNVFGADIAIEQIIEIAEHIRTRLVLCNSAFDVCLFLCRDGEHRTCHFATTSSSSNVIMTMYAFRTTEVHIFETVLNLDPL